MAAKRQGEFVFRTRGGRRDGAGRKKVLPGPRRVPHRRRARVKKNCPLHVTTRIRNHVPRLRNHKRCRVIRTAMFAVLDEPGFRICEFSVQRDHLHLICEASDNAALARGIKRFKQRVARGINRQLGRTGSVFLDRYHFEQMTNPRQVRNTLVYVLQNARRHGVHVPNSLGGIDPYSSGLWFEGWKNGADGGPSPPADGGARCVSAAQTWLLTTGWRKHGLIRIDELPPAATKKRRACRR